MNKADFIKEFVSIANGWERQSLIPALVASLTSEETAQILNPMTLNDPTLRRAILRKVNKDIETEGCQVHHTALVKNLISSFNSLPANKKQVCGYFLNSLYHSLPPDFQQKIMRFFITSRYVTLQNRGYKILGQNWSNEYESIITQSWKKHHEYYCAMLILKHFPDEFLIKHFNSLEKALIGNKGHPQLYIRIGDKKPDLLQRLEKQDGITFTYVMVKLGKYLTHQQASKIFDQFKFDRRIGLFIWCLGKMKLWSVLENIARNSEQLNEETLAWYRKRYGIN